MGFLHLFIINKSGGLVYNQQLQEKAPQLSSNDWLRGGSTFHSLHAIARQIAPCRSKGIVTLETEGFVLRCFQTLTGIKFVLTAEKGTSSMDVVLNMVYELYTDFVLKNPFQDVEQPIQCYKFTNKITDLVDSFHKTGTPAHAKHLYHTRMR
mmetsp:Transcript_13642/g.40638  ORF Transcript_13642/g.40638 Transcript_13642/m.40638 type:complete len:152 (-) Transcript_13642:17-472(-)|eukprot:CAMPEP_0119279362 /NCGR_PEP_ID=MMETSP1329-20130426/20678_1 /TAXON_ID=114041 /ORGANISM="Genus nov. species nov., Strain RCC1024" /LENGTH=151 /DNA_ID=CAMNT_0007279901 /DNA_START=125 /DNA_END=580 /DNA_ORIENTATION=-